MRVARNMKVGTAKEHRELCRWACVMESCLHSGGVMMLMLRWVSVFTYIVDQLRRDSTRRAGTAVTYSSVTRFHR
jgi:cytochrome c oxidase assembly factor CtaG